MDSIDMQDFWSDNEPFPAATEQDWRALVEQTIDRAQFDRKLVYTDFDGIQRQPIYPQAPLNLVPGQFPYTRGSMHSSHNRHGWQIAQRYDEANPTRLNQLLLSELAGGVSSIELRLASDSQHPGLSCRDLASLDTALTGVQPELIHIGLYPDAANTAQAAALLALCSQRQIDSAALSLSLNLDPLGQLATCGKIVTVGAWQNTIITTALFIDSHYATAKTLCVDGNPYHNSGATAAQQIACAIACGIDYLRILTQAGMDVVAAAGQIEFCLALDSELFESVAMLRAMRTLWANVLQHSGVDKHHANICLRARSGTRSLTQRDNAVNMLRVTSQCLAAALGGAQSFNSAAFDQLTGATDKGRRIARNTQLILMEESGIHQVQDPMGGSGQIETLTAQLAEKAWSMVQSIETSGGMFAALSNNWVQNTIAKAREQRSNAIAVGKISITGVSEFPELGTPLSRSAEQVAVAVCDQMFDPQNIAAMIKALCNNEPVTPASNVTITDVIPLPQFRDAAAYESLRNRSDAHLANTGTAPKAALIALGEQSEYGPRVNFSQNTLAAAGIEAELYSLNEWLALATKPALAILCGTDAAYRLDGSQACAQIAANGHTQLWLAGKITAMETAKPDNIEREIHLGCDRVTLLNQALDTLEVAAL